MPFAVTRLDPDISTRPTSRLDRAARAARAEDQRCSDALRAREVHVQDENQEEADGRAISGWAIQGLPERFCQKGLEYKGYKGSQIQTTEALNCDIQGL